MSSLAAFANLDVDKLIQDISTRPAIWDKNFNGRQNKGYLEELWDELAQIHNAPSTYLYLFHSFPTFSSFYFSFFVCECDSRQSLSILMVRESQLKNFESVRANALMIVSMTFIFNDCLRSACKINKIIFFSLAVSFQKKLSRQNGKA